MPVFRKWYASANNIIATQLHHGFVMMPTDAGVPYIGTYGSPRGDLVGDVLFVLLSKAAVFTRQLLTWRPAYISKSAVRGLSSRGAARLETF